MTDDLHPQLDCILTDIARAAGERAFLVGLAELWQAIFQHGAALRVSTDQKEASVEAWKANALKRAHEELSELHGQLLSGWAGLQAAALCKRAVVEISEHGQWNRASLRSAKRELLLAAQAARSGRAA